MGMRTMPSSLLVQQGILSLCVFLLFAIVSVSATETETESFIVHLSRSRRGKGGARLSHRGYLESVLGGPQEVGQSLIYRYNNVFDGFAARLTNEQSIKLSRMEGVLSVVPNTRFEPATTNSWKFLGVESSAVPNTGAVWEQAKYGEDVIIGVVDTGIWPESSSFKDTGLGPIPARWKGKCVSGQNFTAAEHCNKKLVGARFYYAGNPKIPFDEEYKSARDNQGHGTHVASTAAGAFTPSQYYGYAAGTAKGGAPRARIAAYKVCWKNAGCYSADMAAAMEDAVADGVDIISISISGYNDWRFTKDVVGISSFHAMKEGILVNFAAGNSGPSLRTVNHVEPWSFTVAATTQDRFLGSNVVIQPYGSPQSEGLHFRGATISNLPSTTAPVILASDASSGDIAGSSFCLAGTLDPSRVRGKIVFCLKGSEAESINSKSDVVSKAGGVGMIVGNTAQLEDYTIRLPNPGIPAVHVTAHWAEKIVNFFTECDLKVCTFRNASATISKGTTFLGDKPAPVMAYFSSSGPSGVTKDILKPDIAAPGYNILAAWIDGKVNQISGTSMATPHISGIVALVKAVHPKWSPSAIKSAIMTTAKTHDNTDSHIKNLHNKAAAGFSTGSGLTNPVAALDPGLVYDADWRDYALFLCSLKYSDKEVELITGETGFCTGKVILSPSDLNYPSLSVGDLTQPTNVTRRVTQVGTVPSVYKVHVEHPEGIKVTISPSKLSFSEVGETKSFTVSLERKHRLDSQESYVFGSFTWSDGVHKVMSPIVVGSAPHYSCGEEASVDEGLIMSY